MKSLGGTAVALAVPQSSPPPPGCDRFHVVAELREALDVNLVAFQVEPRDERFHRILRRWHPAPARCRDARVGPPLVGPLFQRMSTSARCAVGRVPLPPLALRFAKPGWTRERTRRSRHRSAGRTSCEYTIARPCSSAAAIA